MVKAGDDPMKKKRKKKRARQQTGVVKYGRILLLFCIMVFVSFAVILGAMAFLKAKEPEPVYEYVSMSEEAAARAYIWLSQIEDMPLSYTEIKEMMGDIQLTLVLTPTEEKGKYMRTLAEGTAADCEKKAADGLERAYREVVRYRFLADGYEGECSDDMLDDKMREAYGVSVSEYLSCCEVQLLPALEELTGLYAGEVTDE